MEKDNSWEEQKAVGNIAENIIEFLIKSSPNWKCVKYGMENHIEELKKSLRNNHQAEISRRIKSMPDFIAMNSETNQVLLIDVKFRSFIDRRAQGTALYGFGYAQMKDYLQFWPEAYLVVVHNHEPFFIVIPLKEVEWYKHFYGRTGDGKDMIEQWNFAGIQKPIQELFSNIPDEKIQKAIGMIPKK